jgi:hypothetical protein
MIDRPGNHPLPHAELPTQNPLIFTLNQGEVIDRHHQSVHNPIFFGTTGKYRFDDPGCPAPGSFDVLYAGADPNAACSNPAARRRECRASPAPTSTHGGSHEWN